MEKIPDSCFSYCTSNQLDILDIEGIRVKMPFQNVFDMLVCPPPPGDDFERKIMRLNVLRFIVRDFNSVELVMLEINSDILYFTFILLHLSLDQLVII